MLPKFVLFCCVLFAGCQHSGYQQSPTTSTSFSQAIADGIYVHYGQHLDIDTGYQGDICNLTFIVGDQGVAVIDTGGSLKVGEQLKQAIRQVTDKPILYVINTHVHPDHIFGNAAFTTDKPQFVGHAKLGQAMLTRQAQYEKLNASYLGNDAKASTLVMPNLLVQDHLSLDLGNRTLSIHAHNDAHTHTDISVVDEKTQTLITGDLLFAERTPVIENDIKGLIATLTQFKAKQYALVIPGHGKASKQPQQAFDNALRYLNTLLNDIRADIKQGKSMEQSMSTAAASEKQQWLLFDIANRRNVNVLYPKLEWE